MKHVDKVYSPSHVVIPIGPLSSLSPAEAALACSEYLRSYHTLIPLFMTLESDSEDLCPFRESTAAINAAAEPSKPSSLSS